MRRAPLGQKTKQGCLSSVMPCQLGRTERLSGKAGKISTSRALVLAITFLIRAVYLPRFEGKSVEHFVSRCLFGFSP